MLYRRLTTGLLLSLSVVLAAAPLLFAVDGVIEISAMNACG
jgi:hypothetical protein